MRMSTGFLLPQCDNNLQNKILNSDGGKYHQLQTKMSPDTRENITSYKGKYHKLQVKMSPVIREMPSVIRANITIYR